MASLKPTLPVSCLGSCYIATQPSELYWSIYSLFNGDFIADEIILCVDGPLLPETDAQILNLESEFSIVVLRFSSNRGLGNTLRDGLQACKNEYILRFDTDDISSSSRIQLQFQYLEKRRDLSAIGSFVYEYNLSCSDMVFNYRIKKSAIDQRSILIMSLLANPLNHPSVMFRKSSILSIGGYQNIPLFEDFHLWIRLFLYGHKVENLPTPLVFMHKESDLSRRYGFDYCSKELYFAFSLLRLVCISPLSLLYFVIIFIRSIARLFLAPCVLRFLPWRSRWSSLPVSMLDYNLSKMLK